MPWSCLIKTPKMIYRWKRLLARIGDGGLVEVRSQMWTWHCRNSVVRKLTVLFRVGAMRSLRVQRATRRLEIRLKLSWRPGLIQLLNCRSSCLLCLSITFAEHLCRSSWFIFIDGRICVTLRELLRNFVCRFFQVNGISVEPCTSKDCLMVKRPIM